MNNKIIKIVYSEVDYNDNGIDDYTDILLGAKIDAENRTTYNGAYYSGGYPNIKQRDKNIDFHRVGNLHIFIRYP